jgi:hypothetical protein
MENIKFYDSEQEIKDLLYPDYYNIRNYKIRDDGSIDVGGNVWHRKLSD